MNAVVGQNAATSPRAWRFSPCGPPRGACRTGSGRGLMAARTRPGGLVRHAISRWPKPPGVLARHLVQLGQTPTSFQSRDRQQVMPLPQQPISCGSNSRGMPLLPGIGGRPPWRPHRRIGSSGAIRAHSLARQRRRHAFRLQECDRTSSFGRPLVRCESPSPEGHARRVRLALLDRAGGRTTVLTEGWDRSCSAWHWLDARTVAVEVEDRGRVTICMLAVDLLGREPATLHARGPLHLSRARVAGCSSHRRACEHRQRPPVSRSSESVEWTPTARAAPREPGLRQGLRRAAEALASGGVANECPP